MLNRIRWKIWTMSAHRTRTLRKQVHKMNGKSTVNVRWTICSEQLGCYPPTLTFTRIHIQIKFKFWNVSIDSLQTIARTVAFNSMHYNLIKHWDYIKIKIIRYSELLSTFNIFSFYWWLIIEWNHKEKNIISR